jgi:RimJ/RimL family protein N-acetyltransferase
VEDGHVAAFFAHAAEPGAAFMAAFTRKETDRRSHDAHWAKIRGQPTTLVRTVLVGGAVAGHIASFEVAGEVDVTYWLGTAFWGRGAATAALRQFLGLEARRPLYGRAAADNRRSVRVLEACGFQPAGGGRGFAHGRRAEVEEVALRLDGGGARV